VFARLRAFLKRPVAWGAVLLSYVGIIAAVSYAAATGATFATGLREEAKRADMAMVESGRKAVKINCNFDNQRAKELRGILQRSIKNQKVLVRQGALDPALARRNIRVGRESIAQITIRNCDREARILTTTK